MAPCGSCPSCLQVVAGTHPDVEIVEKPADKSTIPIRLLVGEQKKRMQDCLCARIALTPHMGGRKVAIIDGADYLNAEGANAMLKTLEEPPPKSVIILIGSSEQRQLPTIRSRAQVVRFQRLAHDDVVAVLKEQQLLENEDRMQQIARLANGTVRLDWDDDALLEFRPHFFQSLAHLGGPVNGLAKDVGKIVDAAGKEGPAKRARQKLLMATAADFYRCLVLQLSDDATIATDWFDELMIQYSADLAGSWPGDIESAAACVERCLLAANHVDAMANQATNIASWLDDLSQLSCNSAIPLQVYA